MINDLLFLLLVILIWKRVMDIVFLFRCLLLLPKHWMCVEHCPGQHPCTSQISLLQQTVPNRFTILSAQFPHQKRIQQLKILQYNHSTIWSPYSCFDHNKPVGPGCPGLSWARWPWFKQSYVPDFRDNKVAWGYLFILTPHYRIEPTSSPSTDRAEAKAHVGFDLVNYSARLGRKRGHSEQLRHAVVSW
jgi:hypothetical protein